MKVPGLKPATTTVRGIVWFARMCSKIRLHAYGHLPADYHANLGAGADAHALRLLGICYEDLSREALASEDDEAVLAWRFAHGRQPSACEIEVWNAFMSKRGWRDAESGLLEKLKGAQAFAARDDIQTFFDLQAADESAGGARPRTTSERI